MKLHRIKKLPKGNEYYDTEALDTYDLGYLKKFDIDEVWYWYGSAPYEGNGQMLYRIEDKYGLHNMGHCSCYGPIDNLECSVAPAEDLLSSISEGYMDEVKCLLKAAKLG